MTGTKSTLIFLLIISIAITLISNSMKNIVFVAKADEGLYLKYATMVSENGIKGFRDLFKDYFADKSHRITQNPLRVGFVLIASLWLKLLGYSIYNLALLSLCSYCIFLFLVFYFARKYLGSTLVLPFIILVAFSPINMAMARRALIESTINLFLFFSILLFFLLLKKKNWINILSFILVYSYAILIKEGSAILSLFFLVYLLLTRKKNKEYFSFRGFLIIAIIPFSIAGIIYTYLAGGFTQFYRAMISVVTAPEVNAYAVFFCAGPWFRYLLDFMLLSPWILILGIGFIFFYLTKYKKRDELNYLLIFSICMLSFYSLFIKNIRYLMILDLPLRLFAFLMLYELVSLLFKEKVIFWLTLTVFILSVFDYLNFYYYFVRYGIYDPVSFCFLQASHIIPYK
ncbi:MAG: hypothetical protein COT38_05600 [Candidatus Omnitrophica bacterium CG08_land_8_20_14_0_20_41_16]|uniref:Glycosyltransferase RgtA/B/C/D-like domain-containing protein n=1 Tax=Candidatus Sherwoodlollariibacterium unditelluris TaxID=1974757 RepID=A0A2G9YKX8_9BACT|nr:MAG: hypothetical protein COX41_00425 [Candidatus Omnitrophica bacterium CG23_combo_of_CG06-09_8_20_14_all_41_10]PIS33403.1 MAG: hypothetical protein COT38_05600 [Candidatus Omnitrophica bacterium CG08_land_8_20_14_0_20_41_16]